MAKLTPKREAFCLAYVETGNASEAYRRSYNAENSTSKTIWEASSRLLADCKVNARVFELQQSHAKRHNVTVDSITVELDEARKMATELSKPADMISASNSKAKLHGLITDKRDHISSDGSMTPTIIELVAPGLDDDSED